MSVKDLCNTCQNYYKYTADDGSLLCDGCQLDLPIFSNTERILCNSYRRKV